MIRHPPPRSRIGAAGLGTLLAVMAGYGGFLFVFTLHLQAGLGRRRRRIWAPVRT